MTYARTSSSDGSYCHDGRCGGLATTEQLSGRLRTLTWAIGLVAVAAMPALGDSVTELVSVGPGGARGNSGSYAPSVSASGRFVAFESFASTLVAGDTNNAYDVFLRDRQAGRTSRLSLGPGATQGDAESRFPSISANGRYTAFQSRASNLVPGDTNGLTDVFLRDRQAGATHRLSLGPGDRQGNGDSENPAISADGRFVAFQSLASNLVPGDTNGVTDVFVRDQQAGTTRRVSLGPGGRQGNDVSYSPSISANGRFVAFHSGAGDLVLSDTNGAYDIFVRDRQTSATRRISLGPSGVQADGDSYFASISGDGRFVAFESFATNLVPGDTNGTTDLFVHDRQTGTTRRVSLGPGGRQANGESLSAAISADGSFIAFMSSAHNLVPNDTNGTFDVFVRDRQANTTRRVSLGPGGRQANRESYSASVSADGRLVAFESFASNLVPGDSNDTGDVFVRFPMP
mgnify:CR=1 FL=1